MNSTEQNASVFDHLHDPFARPRKKMVPVWIKVFCWIFIVFACMIPVVAIVTAFITSQIDISVYGFSTTNGLSLIGLGSMAVYLFKGVVGYGLLKEKDWAVTCAIIDGWLGIALTLFSMFAGTFIEQYRVGDESGFHMRMEIFFIIPYLMKMYNIKDEWRENIFARQQALASGA